MEKSCIYCSKRFEKKYEYSKKTWNKQKYCSLNCFHKMNLPWNKGINKRTNTGRTHFKKGLKPWNKGKKFPDYHPPNYKGNDAGYDAIHKWVYYHFPKPDRCNRCGVSTEKLDLSNNSGKYLRDFSDWEYICRSCHWKKDGIGKGNKGENNAQSKLTERQIIEIIKLYKSGELYQRQIAKMFKIHQSHVSDIVNGKRWKHITG